METRSHLHAFRHRAATRGAAWYRRVRVIAGGLAAAVLLAGCASAPGGPRPLDHLPSVDQAIETQIAQRKTPGAAYFLGGKLVYARAYGTQTYDGSAPRVTTRTIYDAASLTKVMATTPAILALVDEGKLALDVPFSRYIGGCDSPALADITLRHLLTHTSGLPAGLPLRDPWTGKTEALRRACAQTPTHAAGTFFRYSDINFILLGGIVEAVSGQPLDRFAHERVFSPLGMQDTGYLPLMRSPVSPIGPNAPIDRIAPTQRVKEGDQAEALLHGVVHDPTARRMGGVAGHAGLFTTVEDISRFANMILAGGVFNGRRVLSAESIRLLSTAQSPDGIKEKRSIGFDIDSPYSRPRGTRFPLGSFGHTGFTGCILWIDPTSQSFYTFLSNRVHPDGTSNIVAFYSTLGTLSAEAALNNP